ncbi:MAG: MopE-related protein [Myxococcota bacterium]|nr:MopE-related protein [Myxococcota bacterium]
MLLPFLFFLACTDQSVQVVNPSPVARIMSHVDGDRVLENYTILLRGTASDSNHGPDELRVTWLSNNRELCPATPAEADGTTSCSTSLDLSEEEITLDVRDPENASDIAKVTLEVFPSGPPEGAITSPNPGGQYYSNVQVPLEATVYDAEADPEDLKVYWNSDLDGDLPVSSQPLPDGTYADNSYLTEGNHRLTLTVEDPQGNQSTDTIDVSVGGENQLPLCSFVEPQDGGSIAEGELLILRAELSDPDVQPTLLHASFSSNIDGELVSGAPTASGEFVFATESLSGGVHTLSLFVEDEVGGGCSDLLLYTVSVPPAIQLNSPILGDVFNSNESILFSASIQDEEDSLNSMHVVWNSNIDGDFATVYADSNGNLSFNQVLSIGNHLITATVYDSDNLSASAQVAIEILDCGATLWYLDADSDGYGNTANSFVGCTPPSGYIAQSGDCDDGDPSQNPDAIEYCNGEDDDCDGSSDETDAADVSTWYEDADGDGYGNPTTLTIACDPPAPTYITTAQDCDDTSLSVNPDAIEICEDGIDNDCYDGDDSCQISVDLTTEGRKILGHAENDYMGYRIRGAGDVDGDGMNDVLIGAYGADFVNTNGQTKNAAGITYLVGGSSLAASLNSTGNLNISTLAFAKLYGEFSTDFSGRNVAPAGDINQDGYADILIGAHQEDSSGTDSGAAYLVYGPLSGEHELSDAAAKFVGVNAEDYAGFSLDGNGDFNGDGYPDILVGAYAEDSAANNTGRTYLIYGSATPTYEGTFSLDDSDLYFDGEDQSDFAGYAVAFVGDTDGDGLDDILIGAYGDDNTGNASGTAYLVRGGSTAGSLFYADSIFEGCGSNHFAGQSLSTGGDFNQDGLSDMLIGASGEDSKGNNTGAAYMVYGSATQNYTSDLGGADIIFYGENSLDYAGISLSSSEDLDGDGGSDLLIGASGYNSSMGTTYVVFGSEGHSGTVELENTYAKVIGGSTNDYIGWSVTGLGDIDGDQLNDIAIGAYRDSTITPNTGATYILLGSLW